MSSEKLVFDDVGPAVVIVVGGIDAHAGLLASVRTVSHARFCAYLGETALAVVVVEQAGRRIVGYVKIEAAVEVIVQPQNAQAVVGMPGSIFSFLSSVTSVKVPSPLL